MTLQLISKHDRPVKKITVLRPANCCVAVLGDMLELGEADDLHVGKVPALVNNQMELCFAFEPFVRSLRFKIAR